MNEVGSWDKMALLPVDHETMVVECVNCYLEVEFRLLGGRRENQNIIQITEQPDGPHSQMGGTGIQDLGKVQGADERPKGKALYWKWAPL